MATEKSITLRITKWLDQQSNCWWLKYHGGMYSTAGTPDILVSWHGHFYAFEVKQPGKYPTPIQKRVIAQINAAGGQAHVVRSLEDVQGVFTDTAWSHYNERSPGEPLGMSRRV
tara:strand:+ start:215 stop:556 length:342 start_codon:yes stop_codon:yes gene_type:complete